MRRCADLTLKPEGETTKPRPPGALTSEDIMPQEHLKHHKKQARKYQLDALEKCRYNVAQGVKSQVLMVATGGGKTFIASMVAESVVKKGGRFFFIVDSLELVDQAARAFKSAGLGVGVIQGFHEWTDYSQPIQVATIQTLRNRWANIATHLQPTVVMIDECHVIHSTHEKIINECKFKSIPVIGLSATPFRKSLGKFFDELVVGATTADLTKQGYLAPARCYAPYIPNLDSVRKKNDGDWQEDALGEFMGAAKIVGDVVNCWKKLGENRQTLVFACNVAHSKLLRDAFKAEGIAADHIDGYETDMDARKQKVEDFKSGKIQVLCNVAVLTKGFDAPSTSCIVVARPTKSLMMHIQILGRGLRTSPGKTDCIIIDHAGNCIRNGLPTEQLPAELDDGEMRRNLDRKSTDKDEPTEHPCPSCGFLKLARQCPSCKYVYEKLEDVERRDGELREIKTTKKANQKATPEEKIEFFGELKHYAMEKGYREGWASNQYRSKFGVWPNAYRDAPLQAPSQETLNFIKHRQIAYSKRSAA